MENLYSQIEMELRDLSFKFFYDNTLYLIADIEYQTFCISDNEHCYDELSKITRADFIKTFLYPTFYDWCAEGMRRKDPTIRDKIIECINYCIDEKSFGDIFSVWEYNGSTDSWDRVYE